MIANAGTWDNAYESKEEKYIIFSENSQHKYNNMSLNVRFVLHSEHLFYLKQGIN